MDLFRRFLKSPEPFFGGSVDDKKLANVLKVPKKEKKYTEPLKDLTVCPQSDPFFFETFLSFVDQKIGFVGKYETFRVSYYI